MSSTENNECPRCREKITQIVTQFGRPINCPNCGLRLTHSPSTEVVGLQIVQKYFSDLWEIIFQPRRFFRRMPRSNGLSGPLAFALITHWIGVAFAFLWQSIFGGMLGGHVTRLLEMVKDIKDTDIHHPGRSAQLFQVLEFRDRLTDWFKGAGSVIIDPFLTLAAILISSFFVYLGARILVSPGQTSPEGEESPPEITYESAVRIVCYGMTPAIFAAIPLFGPALSYIAVIIVTVIGAKHVYRINTGRAIIVALFPKLLFLGIILMGLFVFFVTLIKLLTAMF